MIHHATYYNNPDYLTYLLNEHNHSKPQRTIYKYKLFIQNSRKLTRKQETAFSLAAPKLWNSLPYDIRSIYSTPIFKSRLKTHLFNTVQIHIYKLIFENTAEKSTKKLNGSI